jgi:hypothetical protein
MAPVASAAAAFDGVEDEGEAVARRKLAFDTSGCGGDGGEGGEQR